MAFPGSIVSDWSNILIRMPAAPIVPTVEYNNALFKLFQRDASRLVPSTNADYWTIRYYDGVEMTAGARTETGDVHLPGGHSTSEGRVYPKEVAGAIGWTQWELNLLNRDPNAFAERYVDKMRHFAPGFKNICQAVQMGDGTGRLARVSAYTATNATSGTVTIDSNIANFGISDMGSLLKDNMVVDIYTVPDVAGSAAWTEKATSVVISNLNRTAGTFTITTLNDNVNSAITSNPADNDFVFLQNSFTLASDDTGTAGVSFWNYPPGLWAMVDDDGSTGQEFNDGSSNDYNASWYGSTIQNRSRTSVGIYTSTVSDAGDRSGTKGTAQETTWDEIADEIRNVEEDLDFSRGSRHAILANGAIIDWLGLLTRSTANVRVNLGQEEEVIAGLKTGEFLQTSNGRIPMFRIPMMSTSVLTMVCWDDIYRIDVEELGPVPHEPGGPLQFASPGTRNRTYESWVVWGGSNWFTRADRHLRIEDIDRTYY
jgi:hypothetical protein